VEEACFLVSIGGDDDSNEFRSSSKSAYGSEKAMTWSMVSVLQNSRFVMM
jgi:hypothetical protein